MEIEESLFRIFLRSQIRFERKISCKEVITRYFKQQEVFLEQQAQKRIAELFLEKAMLIEKL